MARTSSSSKPLTDHEEIRRWAEERGAKPTCVRGTGSSNDVGMIRLDFPGYTGEDKLEEIPWDEWFDKFDENGLALLVQDRTARGQRSNFNKLVSRETAGVSEGNGSSRGARSESRRRGSSRDQEGYEASSGYSGYSEEIEGSDEDLEEDLEEDMDVEESRPVRASGAGNSRNRKRQARTTGREGSRSARSSATARRSGSQAGRSRNERSTKARTSTSKRGQATGGSRSSSKKAPGRARTGGSRTTSRGRSSSRKRAA